MATQLNFDQLKQELDRAQISTAAFVAEFNKLKASGKDVNKLLQAMDATLDGVKSKGQDINSTFGDLVTTLKNITSEFWISVCWQALDAPCKHSIFTK